MSITKRRAVVALAAVLVLAVITSVFSMISAADESSRADYSVSFAQGGFIHADSFADSEKIFIIDVSSHQQTIDWEKVYASGIDGVMLRVGYTGYKYGTYNSDTCFETFYNGAKAAGLKIGAYYYGQPTCVADALTEANYALGLLNGRSFDLPVAYDLEYATNDTGLTGRLYESDFTPAALTNIANTFCSKIKNAGYSAMIYVNCTILTQHMLQSSLLYPVWIARYNSYVDYVCTYTMWQFSSTSSISGISGNCDVSVFYKSKSSSTEETGTTASSGDSSSDSSTTQTTSDEQVTTSTEAEDDDSSGSTDYFTMFLDFMLKIFESIAKFVPQILSFITSMS